MAMAAVWIIRPVEGRAGSQFVAGLLHESRFEVLGDQGAGRGEFEDLPIGQGAGRSLGRCGG